jgi:hypothetical protein
MQPIVCVTEEILGLGYDRRGYIPVKVDCETYDGKKIEAYALIVERPRHPVSFWLAPSARYMGKIVEGAKKFVCDARYITELEKQPVTQRRAANVAVVLAAALPMLPLILVVVLIRFVFPKGRLQLMTMFTLLNFARDTLWLILGPIVPSAARLERPVRVSIPSKKSESH